MAIKIYSGSGFIRFGLDQNDNFTLTGNWPTLPSTPTDVLYSVTFSGTTGPAVTIGAPGYTPVIGGNNTGSTTNSTGAGITMSGAPGQTIQLGLKIDTSIGGSAQQQYDIKWYYVGIQRIEDTNNIDPNRPLTGGFGQNFIRMFYTNDIFVVPPNVTKVRVRLWGGGSAVANNNGYIANSARGGAFSMGEYDVTPGSSITVTVAGKDTVGGVNGTSSFGSFISANSTGIGGYINYNGGSVSNINGNPIFTVGCAHSGSLFGPGSLYTTDGAGILLDSLKSFQQLIGNSTDNILTNSTSIDLYGTSASINSGNGGNLNSGTPSLNYSPSFPGGGGPGTFSGSAQGLVIVEY